MLDGPDNGAKPPNAAQQMAQPLLQAMRLAPSTSDPFFGSHLDMAETVGDRLIVWLDPARVAKQLDSNIQIQGGTLAVGTCCLGKGDWSKWLKPIETTLVDREVREVLACGLAYRAAPCYKRFFREFEAKRPTVRNMIALDTPERVEAYFTDLVRLIESIRARGVTRRPPRRLNQAAALLPALSAARPLATELTESEIGIAVGPAGELFRLGPGHHRMSIARQIGLRRVPAELRLFHVRWVREQMRLNRCGPLRAIRIGLASLGVEPVHPVTEKPALARPAAIQIPGE